MDEDPEVLAAIEASKQDYLEGDDLEDPLIKAALAESMKDAEIENPESHEDSNDNRIVDNIDGKLRAGDETGDDIINDKTCEDKHSQEGCDSKLESSPGCSDTPETNPLSSEEGIEDHPTGDQSEGDPEESKNVDHENNDTETDSQGGGEITLEGVPEIQENPFTEQPQPSTEDCDPLEDHGGGGGDGGEGGEAGEDGEDGGAQTGGMEEMSELIDQVTPSRSRHTSAGSSKSHLSGTKRKRSSSCSSNENWESNKKKELGATAKTSKECLLFNCPVCSFSSDVLGEVNIHKYRSQCDQQKPSYLDIAETVIFQLDNNFGCKKEVILEEMQKNYSEFLESDIQQSSQILSRALTGGVQLGRLWQGGSNASTVYFVVSREKRRIILEKWKINKRSVEYKDVKNIAEGSKEFKEIQATLNRLNILVTSSSAKQKTEDSDDEICVVEEKITEKARRRAEHRKKLIAQKRRQLAMQREAAKAGPKTVIKVNSAQGKNLIRKIVATGSVPKQAMKSQTKKSFRLDDEEEDPNLTCPVCLSSFWYPNQTHQHMKNVHNIENPGKYIKEKSSRKKISKYS